MRRHEDEDVLRFKQQLNKKKNSFMNEDEKLHRSNNRKKVTEYLGRAHGYNLTHFHTEIMMTDEYNSS